MSNRLSNPTQIKDAVNNPGWIHIFSVCQAADRYVEAADVRYLTGMIAAKDTQIHYMKELKEAYNENTRLMRENARLKRDLQDANEMLEYDAEEKLNEDLEWAELRSNTYAVSDRVSRLRVRMRPGMRPR